MVCKVYCPTAEIQEIGVVPDEGYNPYFFPVEGAYLSFYFTDETFMKVLSALVNGAQVTYGDEGRAVVWEFLRNVEYPVSLCDQIADCITNNPATRQAIVDLVLSDPSIRDYITAEAMRLTSEQTAGSIMTGECGNSAVAGQVIAIVDKLDEYNTDALQIVEIGTNDEERLATFISGFPAFGLLPADEVLDTMQDWLEDFSENYAAAITPEWKDDVSEDLYCLALSKPDCSLTYQDLFEYFNTRASSGLSILSTVFDLVQFLADGDFNSDELVASGMFSATLSGIVNGRNFFGLTLPTIAAITRDAPSSSAWEDWDECDTPPPVSPITIFNPAGHSGGTYEATGENTARFTASIGGDTVYRVAFQYDNDAPRCVRMNWSIVSGSLAAGFNGTYECGANPAANGYLDGLTVEMPPQGECFAGLGFGSFSPFVIDITFDEC